MQIEDIFLLKLKAEAFDRILQLYLSLDDGAGFYSKNWVLLSEALDQELANLKQAESDE